MHHVVWLRTPREGGACTRYDTRRASNCFGFARRTPAEAAAEPILPPPNETE